MADFKDHFSEKAGAYAAHRPTYPPELAAYLAGLPARPGTALDVGCGTGQLSTRLAAHFESVVATDASAEQVAKATSHPRVAYRVAPAEASGMEPASCDLVVAAQAAHWFDLALFHAEVRRVARPGAAVALVAYGIIRAEPEVEPVMAHFYHDVAGPHWPPERVHVERGYRDLDFPYAETAAPALAIRVEWTLEDLVGYVGTWSALRGAERALGASPLPPLRAALAEVWGDPARARTFTFPLALRVGRV